MIVGHDKAVERFASAWASRKLHHAWLLGGPRGVGKASFAHAAARRVLADAGGPRVEAPGLDDLVVDTAEWNLPDPVGLCLEEVRELRAVIEQRVSSLPL